jgi:hypothetical protein
MSSLSSIPFSGLQILLNDLPLSVRRMRRAIRKVSLDQLEAFSQALLDFATLEDLRSHLKAASNQSA